MAGLAERFAAKYVEADNGCWLWIGGKDVTGYGKMLAFGRIVLAHRVAYELHVGPIPNDRTIHHVCEVKLCVNPEHLVVITRSEHGGLHSNHTDVCPRGHERAQLPSGRWHCPECSRRWARQYHARKRAERRTPENVYYGTGVTG